MIILILGSTQIKKLLTGVKILHGHIQWTFLLNKNIVNQDICTQVNYQLPNQSTSSWNNYLALKFLFI